MAGSLPMVTIHPISSTRLLPDPVHRPATSKDLSITESVTSTYSPPQAVWFYDAPEDPKSFLADTFAASLRKALVAYPHLAGQLHQIPFRAGGRHAERHGRLSISYGQPDDAGVEFVVARCEQKLATILPSPEDRGKCWDPSALPLRAFAGQELQMALHDGFAVAGLPPLVVKVTQFACGGVAIAIRVVHPMCDASSMLRFVHDWATVHRAIVSTSPELPKATVVFDPSMLDAFAAGDVDADRSDPALVHEAMAMPIHRFDFWASAKGCPKPFLPRTVVPSELEHVNGVFDDFVGTPIPWSDWDIAAPVMRRVLRFTAKEIHAIHSAASAPSSPVSHLDALLAHLWTIFTRARGLHNTTQPVYLNFPVDFRRRLSPPLPINLVGVPACMMHVRSTGPLVAQADPKGGNLALVAPIIRSHIQSINPSTIPAFLHLSAHTPDVHRHWQFFGGRHHLSATSWLGSGEGCDPQRVDFGAGRRPRYVLPIVPDFMMCIWEASGPGGLNDPRGEKTKWYNGDVEVTMHFEVETMEKVLNDPALRAYE